jgi:heavy metal translocating P-type ATPase
LLLPRRCWRLPAIEWQTKHVSKALRNDYGLLVLTLLSLVLGLTLPADSLQSILSFASGATIGFVLSLILVIRAIRLGEFGSDVLALIAIAATSLTSEWIAASVISVMLATGRALERWAEGRARTQLESLLARAPRVAHVLDATGNPVDLPLNKVNLGSHLLVRSGEVVPLDGTVLIGGTFDESALTGEPIPQFVANGEEVPSGVVNSGGTVEIVTTKTAADSTYSALVRLVQQAQASSANGVRVANKWAVRFVPFALLLAAATWLITGETEKAVAVIVAATPCPLILAVPVAIIAGMSKAAAHGAIIKGGAALEQLARTKTVLVDKTGTLTQGGPEVSVVLAAPNTDIDLTLKLAASLEQSSPHVVAKSLIAEAKRRNLELQIASDVVEEHGVGLSGVVAGFKVRVGQPNTPLPVWAKINNALVVAIEINGELKAVIGLDDPLRDEAGSTMNDLRAMGVERIVLVSGDRQSTADLVGAAVGVDEVFGDCTPEGKLEIVHAEMLATKGSVVAVGDGINDAPALAAASVGVAMGARGATAASEAADVVIIEDSIKHLATAVLISKGARSRALQAAGVGMTLAIGAMFAAATGLLDATAAAVSQEFIDMAAILWALVPVKTKLKN